MTKTKRLILLMLLLLPVQLRAAITATSQDLDEFSFKDREYVFCHVSQKNY